MVNNSKPFLVSAVLVSSLFLGGCGLVAQPADVATESPVTSITGKVMVAGEMVSISSSGKITEIYSRKIDLKQYDGKDVTVTGEFSGTTLFVDTVK
jgi:hypothetical protein